MDKGGTKQPIKKQTSGFKVGDKVVCIYAGSSWHKVGRKSDVVPHPVSQLPSVVALDGFNDELCMTVSKFEKEKT